MGLFKKLFGRAAAPAASSIMDSAGKLANDIRSAITGDMPTEKKAELYSKILDITLETTKMQSNVIIAEAQGSFLQRNWRPLLMVMFMFIIGWNYIIAPIFRVVTLPIPKQLWTVLMIGVGGYVSGRSAEKIVSNISRRK